MLKEEIDEKRMINGSNDGIINIKIKGASFADNASDEIIEQ